jgi:nucleotide-binding universal stress UspA family protein
MPSNGQLMLRRLLPETASSSMAKTRKSRTSKTQNQPTNILVPVDFSPVSRFALIHAASVVNKSSRIILLHVIGPADESNPGISITQARERLSEFCKNDGVIAPELIAFDVRNGTPFREILQYVEENDVAMIVLGVHASPFLDGIALGHTVDRVSRYAPCPVLLVREKDGTVITSKRAVRKHARIP